MWQTESSSFTIRYKYVKNKNRLHLGVSTSLESDASQQPASATMIDSRERERGRETMASLPLTPECMANFVVFASCLWKAKASSGLHF